MGFDYRENLNRRFGNGNIVRLSFGHNFKWKGKRKKERKKGREEGREMKKEKSTKDGKKSKDKSPTNGTRIRWAINPKIILCSSCRRVPVSAWWVSAIVRMYDWPAGVQRLINFKEHLLIIKLFQTRANVETHSDVIIVCKNLPPLPLSPYFSSRLLLTLFLLHILSTHL